ncbi:glycosyltransferase family 2 protein [Limnoglobus roseus]|uniref:GT2 family glycosyltransferase n=1 Tax=Limnoglobus roseus TaxID=2598579 RepID=A0A5C1AJT4_9BACT|nr:glycosyltransferase [Limnoglobus roseus]QEL17168.1 GT2 family glycosyltransferase [Limnoglobus roseus]
MKPHVSVVMAAKNYARFLPAAVESVFAQTVADWELVIIDDGSTDETPTVVKPFLSDARVRYVRSDKLGQPRAKNLGIQLGRGDVIAFLDADDAWQPTKLEQQLALLRDDVGVVFCGRELIDESGKPLAKQPAPNPPTGRVMDKMFVQNFVCFSSAMVRRQVFDHVGSFDPQWDLAIDFDLWLRVAKHYSFAYVPEPLVLYRTGHGNLSQKLSDRVATAFSIMHRHRHAVSREAVAEGYGSTACTMGWVLRAAEPRTAFGWYWQAFQWPTRRWESAKGMLVSILNVTRGRQVATAAENLSVNV